MSNSIYETNGPTCLSESSIRWGGGTRNAMVHTNLKKEGGRSPGSANKYTKFGQLIIWKSINIIATRCHILRPKCAKFDSWSVRLSLMEFDTTERRPQLTQNRKTGSDGLCDV